jgi:hypothetical protein
LEQSADALAHFADQQEARANQAESEVDALARQHRAAEDELSTALEKLKFPPVPPTPVPDPDPAPYRPRPDSESEIESEGEGDRVEVFDRVAGDRVREDKEHVKKCGGVECDGPWLYLDQFDKWGKKGRHRTKCRQCLSEK